MVPIWQLEHPPTEDDWKKMMETASPEEAVRLRNLAGECLAATKAMDQRLGILIGIAERTMRARGIPLD